MKKENKENKKNITNIERKKKKISEEERFKIKAKKEIEETTEREIKNDNDLEEKSSRYFEATGRRKTAVARVRLYTKGPKEILVNEKSYKVYFPTFELQKIVEAPLEKMKCFDKFHVLVKVKGGGIHAQAEAVRHGIARALVEFNPDFRKRLRRAGYLTRDPRQRERKKFGLKRARRAPQWQKR
jgi:small subunit ribosomal protein S9